MIYKKKASTLLILNVLKKYSDENHFLTQQQIIDLVHKDYNILLERKSVANSLQILMDLDYDVFKNGRRGYVLYERTFDKSEVTFLIDAIFSSKAISGCNAKSLSNKVIENLSIHDRKLFDYLYKSEGITRTNNKNIFYNIEIINEALRKKKWIGFKYLDYDENNNLVEKFDGYEYHASPCYLVNNFGNYYLLGYRNKYNAVNAYRIDYMKDVVIVNDREMLDPKSLKEFSKYESITDFMNDHIYLFDGESIKTTLKLKGPYVIKYINDWFGKNASIYKENNDLYVTVKCNENAMFYWVMQYSEHIEIIGPESLKQKIINAAQNIIKKYN